MCVFFLGVIWEEALNREALFESLVSAGAASFAETADEIFNISNLNLKLQY